LPVFGYGVISGIDLDPADSCGVISDPRSPYALALAYVSHGRKTVYYSDWNQRAIRLLGRNDPLRKANGTEKSLSYEPPSAGQE